MYSTHSHDDSGHSNLRDTYWALGALVAASIAAFALFLAFPGATSAFWPFSTSEAATSDAGGIIHDPSLGILKAAVNIDPNPSKHASLIAMTGGSALIADAGLDGTIADSNSGVSKNGRISLYVVRSGDTLSEIATMFEVSANTILFANNLKSAKDIHPGDTLTILPVSGIEHVVLKGETLASLAKKFSADADEIASYNGLDSRDPLTLGANLIIPGGEIPVARATTRSTRALKTNPYRGGGGPDLPGFFAHPVPGAILTQSIHGWNGVDLGARTGTPIHAAASGVVIIARTGGWNSGYGSYVVIDHGNGTQSLYAHMSRNISSVGESVEQGQIVGYVGATGLATGPHLHFEIRGGMNPFASCRVMSVCSI